MCLMVVINLCGLSSCVLENLSLVKGIKLIVLFVNSGVYIFVKFLSKIGSGSKYKWFGFFKLMFW